MSNTWIYGNVGKAPEIKTFGDDLVVTFSVAVNETYTTRGNEKKQHTEWYNVETRGHAAKIAQEHVHKGSPVVVIGKLRTRKWEDNGTPKSYQAIYGIVFPTISGKHMELGDAVNAVTAEAEDDLPF